MCCQKKEVFEKCKELALKYGRRQEVLMVSLTVEYEDPFGCSLYILYKEVDWKRMMASRNSIQVYLGGREVYFLDEYTGDEYYESGNWERLIDFLLGPHAYNRSLIGACKNEADKNEALLLKYLLGCGALARAEGAFYRTSYGTSRYVFAAVSKTHELKILLNHGSLNHLFIWYDGTGVFSYRWGGKQKEASGNGRCDRGEWEKAVYSITRRVLSAA